MRKVPERRLWIGNAADLRNPAAIMAAEIAALIELADGEPSANLPRDLVRGRFPLSDGGDNPAWLLRLAAETVAALVRAEVPTLVCCSAGMSRSVAIAAAGLALADARSLEDSLRTVAAAGPHDVSPTLYAQLQRAIMAPANDSGLPAPCG